MLIKRSKGDSFHIRLANHKDKKKYFEWANDKSVRKISKTKRKIEYSSHLKWFKKKLKSNKTLLLLFEKKKKPVGQVRVDRIQNKLLITYSVDRKFRNMGVGKKILKIAENRIKRHFKISNLFAKVVKDNYASIKILGALSYTCYYKANFLYYKKKLK